MHQAEGHPLPQCRLKGFLDIEMKYATSSRPIQIWGLIKVEFPIRPSQTGSSKGMTKS